MTLPLPTLVDDPKTQQNLDALAQQFPVLLKLKAGQVTATDLAASAKELFIQLLVPANRKEAFGSSSVTYTASETSSIVEITHGLGVPPIWVGIMGEDWSMWKVSSLGTTKFKVQANYYAVISNTTNFKWRAIG